MSSTYSVTQAQSQLPSLIKKAEAGEPVRIRRRDETVALLVSGERMEAIVETMELLANPKAMKAIEAHRAGRVEFLPLSALDD
jgi:PHD/YefM family antitoxin component YafN of YafNO toxin-antitoxin module